MKANVTATKLIGRLLMGERLKTETTAILQDAANGYFGVGDRVRITGGESSGVRGQVVSAQGGKVTVRLDLGGEETVPEAWVSFAKASSQGQVFVRRSGNSTWVGRLEQVEPGTGRVLEGRSHEQTWNGHNGATDADAMDYMSQVFGVARSQVRMES